MNYSSDDLTPGEHQFNISFSLIVRVEPFLAWIAVIAATPFF